MSKRLIFDSGCFFGNKNDVLTFGVQSWILRSIFNICSTLDVYDIAICWDSNKSLRKEFWLPYKANRHQNDDFTESEWAMFNQMKDMTRKTILPFFGITNNFRKNGYEADDLVAASIDNAFENIIVSNDHDLYQLLADNGTRTCSIYQPMKKRMYTFDDFCNEFPRLEVWDYVKYKAMVGDSSDNIQGITGVGPKKAMTILRDCMYQEVYDAFSEIIDRNIQLMELPYKGTGKVSWEVPQIDEKKFEEAVNKYNLHWFLSPAGIACCNKFFNGYKSQKVKRSIRIRRHGGKQ